MDRQRHFETRAVHSGEHRAGAKEDRDGTFYPISTPIYASTTFSHPNVETTDRVLGGEEQGYSYARYDNPTVRAFEEALVSLEVPRPETEVRAFAFASGMAATHAAFAAAELTSGATVLAAEQLYGSTATLLVQVFGANGVETRFVDAYDLGAVEKKVAQLGPRAVVVESISNPLLRVADISAISEITRAAGAALIVDNTFGTPYLQRPLELGADIVVHSATKYLSGTRRPDGRRGRGRPALRRRRGATTQARRGRARPLRGLARPPRPQDAPLAGWAASARTRARSQAASTPTRRWRRSTTLP